MRALPPFMSPIVEGQSPAPKRKPIPLRVKLEAALLALGLEPHMVEFNHDPPLGLRLRDLRDPANETVPAQLDPRFIVPVLKSAHDKLTNGDHVPLSGHKSQIAKLKRLEKAPRLHQFHKLGEAAWWSGEPIPDAKADERKAWRAGWKSAHDKNQRSKRKGRK